MTISEGVAALPGKRLAEFITDHDARAQYVARYMGAADGRNSSRLLASLERLVGGGRGNGDALSSPMSLGEMSLDASR
jgi:hypothetical protein